MQGIQAVPMQQHCPSSSTYSSPISFAAKVIKQEHLGFHHKNPDGTNTQENDGADEDFEFAFVNCQDTDIPFPVTADQIFSNGIIKPIFPIAGSQEEQVVHVLQGDENKDTVSPCPRIPLGRLFVKEFSSSSASSSSSETDFDLPDSYCIWKPKTVKTYPGDHCPNKKSKSIGDSSFKLGDLIRRSNSDLHKTYVYFDNHHHPQPLSSDGRSLGSILRRNYSDKGTKEDPKPSHEMHYLRNQATKQGDKRRSFLPYKRGLIGFFGFNRKLYPFA